MLLSLLLVSSKVFNLFFLMVETSFKFTEMFCSY